MSTATTHAASASRAEDERLDPAVERVRAKLAKLMLVSVGTLILGVVAVLAAVIWRAGSDNAPASAGNKASIRLLPGARLVSSDLSEGGLLLRIDRADGARELVVIDTLSGATRLSLTIESAAPEVRDPE